MRKIKEVLRLKETGLSVRQIAASLRVPPSTVADYLKRAGPAGLSRPLDDRLNEAELEQMLFPVDRHTLSKSLMPDYGYIHTQLKKKGVTLQLLWEEHLEESPGGHRYTQFCHYYRQFKGKLNLSMRQVHKAGEKMFVDFVGKTVGIVDASTGEIKEAQVFVAVLGASNYTFAQAVWSQDIYNWTACHARAFEFFGGVTAIVVPDNLGSGISKACRYEPDINPTYLDMAKHYGCAVIPARVAKPKDKSKVEVGVQIVTRWILARLRNYTFFSLSDLNQKIAELLKVLNDKGFAKLPGTRKSQFKTIDSPALKPLPNQSYEFAQFKKAVVNIDYHIDVSGHYYSVPHQLVREKVEARITRSIVEVLYRGKRVASHQRSYLKGRPTTLPEHMPKDHRRHLEWTPSRIINWAGSIGPNVKAFIETLIEAKDHPEQGYRAALGVIRLAKAYGPDRLDAAAKRALCAGALSYKSVKLILKNNLDGQTLSEQTSLPIIEHVNIRGSDYYH